MICGFSPKNARGNDKLMGLEMSGERYPEIVSKLKLKDEIKSQIDQILKQFTDKKNEIAVKLNEYENEFNDAMESKKIDSEKLMPAMENYLNQKNEIERLNVKTYVKIINLLNEKQVKKFNKMIKEMSKPPKFDEHREKPDFGPPENIDGMGEGRHPEGFRMR